MTETQNNSSLNIKEFVFVSYKSGVGNSVTVWQLCSRKSSMSQALPICTVTSQGDLPPDPRWRSCSTVTCCREWRTIGPAGSQESLLESGALDFACILFGIFTNMFIGSISSWFSFTSATLIFVWKSYTNLVYTFFEGLTLLIRKTLHLVSFVVGRFLKILFSNCTFIEKL